MSETNFKYWLTQYLTSGLLEEQKASPRTAETYKSAFAQFFEYMKVKHGINLEELTVEDLTKANVKSFLDWLENEKKNSLQSCNLRLASLKGFSRYIKLKLPNYSKECELIQTISSKKAPRKDISYLSAEGIDALLNQVNLHFNNGLRDLLILTLFSSTGLRVSELTELKVKDVSFRYPSRLIVRGRKEERRTVPLKRNSLTYLKEYFKRMGYDSEKHAEEPLFKNHSNQPFTRQGINFLVKKYADLARKKFPELIPDEVTPQNLRHSLAMQMVTAGAPLDYVKQVLGHASVTTTRLYVKVEENSKQENSTSTSGESLASPTPELLEQKEEKVL